MILWLLNWIDGWCKLTGEQSSLAVFLNLCRSKCYPYWGLGQNEDRFLVCMRRRILREFQRDAEALGVRLTSMEVHGLPYLIQRYKNRWGVLVGGSLMILMIWLSGNYIWRIEVKGVDHYHERDVIEELANHGFGIGSYIPAVDVNQLQNRLLIDSERFGWISVNILGTTAKVEVIEIKRKQEAERSDVPQNLVAAFDGQITLLSVRRGFPAVAIGDVVRQGELLVSGLRETVDRKTLHESADGEIYAQVKHRIQVEIPFVYEKKVYSGDKITQNSMIFFGKEIKLSRNTGILGTTCDTIDNERILTFFNRISVPVSFRSTTHLLYSTSTAVRSEAEARRLAEYTLMRECEAILGEAELIGRSVEESKTERGIVLDCTLYCIRNIAVDSPIYLGEYSVNDIDN